MTRATEPTTMAEKVLSDASGEEARAGDVVEADLDLVMAHDGSSVLAVEAMKEMDEEPWDSDKVVVPFDHYFPAPDEDVAEQQSEIRDWTTENGIDRHEGEGICHRVLPEKDYINPGDIVVGGDSHTCSFGALGAFSTGVGSTDIAEALISGKLWFRVPETIKVEIEEFDPSRSRITPKDLTLKIVSELGASGANYSVIEYHGDCIEDLSVEERITLCNMGVEMDAKSAVIPPDETTFEYTGKEDANPVYSDPGSWDEEIRIQAPESPLVARPGAPEDAVPVDEVEGTAVDQAHIGTCTNGGFSDIAAAAEILEGSEVAPETRLIVVPATKEALMRANEEGISNVLMEAGATILNPGCGPCMGYHQGVVGDGEVCISSGNRNFDGRMGSGDVYLGSPETVAASAVEGEITNPAEVV